MENIKGEMLPVGTAALDSVLGYAVVFIGLALLMLVIMLMGKIMVGPLPIWRQAPRLRRNRPSPPLKGSLLPAAPERSSSTIRTRGMRP